MVSRRPGKGGTGSVFPMTSPRWSVVLFDLDGTLVDTMDLIVRSYQVAFREVLGQEVSEESVRPLVGMTLPDALVDHPSDLEALITSYRAFNHAHLEDLQCNYAGVTGMLTALTDAGVRTGVVTSKSRVSAVRSLAASGLADIVPLLVGQDDTELHKPHPEPLLKAMAALGATPGTTAYVGDSTWDLLAARAAGVTPIGVTWGAGTREALAATEPLALAETPADLVEILLGEGVGATAVVGSAASEEN